ncbi:galactonate dehydratase (plasmid) [Haloplanus ruber]|uniref:Galactonate dehydratase n=1 Tax=Haloplanus ruber TaxID=869892 RepID=A0ABD6CW26_9EURY|nr:galactonate dehydratase [Haloplanus ruber]
MHVTGYELFSVPPRWLFLKLTTSDGTVGWGEPALEGRTRTVRAAVSELVEDFLLGNDPMEIERHWQRCYRGGHYRGGPILSSAIAGIDQALWDIKGQQLGVPVYQLLGGRARDRIPLYQWVGGDQPGEVAADAERAVDDGYSVVKLTMTARSHTRNSEEVVEIARDRVAAVDDAVGDEADIAVDCRGRISKGRLPRLASVLEPYGVRFLEEPVLPDQNESLERLSPTVGAPMATGQRMYTRWDFKRVLGNDAVAIVQPDITHAGGISEVKKIAAMAEAYDVDVMPKCPVGPISLAACLQIDFSTPNAVLQEQSIGVHELEGNEHLRYLEDPTVFEYDDGNLEPPTEPGLGIDVDESYVREQSEKEIRWQTPLWHHEDGSVAEW